MKCHKGDDKPGSIGEVVLGVHVRSPDLHHQAGGYLAAPSTCHVARAWSRTSFREVYALDSCPGLTTLLET